MDQQAEKLNEAIEMLKKGASLKQPFLDLDSEASELLQLSRSLRALPKNQTPTPLMNHKYATAQTNHLWFAWTRSFKMAAVSAGALLLISAFGITGYAAYNSTPGQTLFAVKKSAEKLQIVLAYNENKKASLQLELAQKRLNEAQKVFQNPQSNIEQEKAALAELTDQTKNAVEVVNAITKNNPQNETSQPLLSSLENLAVAQKTLIQDIKPNSEIDEAAQTAMASIDESTAKISEIKQSMAVAGSEQALTALNGNPNAVAVLGEVSELTKEKIVVENTTFYFGSQTLIKNEDDKILTADDLKIKAKVSIFGEKIDDKLMAEKITLTANPSEPEVKSAYDSKVASSTASNGADTKTSKPEIDIEDKPQNDPNQAVGTYIFEDPSPQYVK